MLVLDTAGYRYPSAALPAVNGADLRVDAGEFVLLTGPTGCGKSTLLRLSAGLVQRHGHGDVTGKVRVGDTDPAQVEPSQRVGTVAFVSQDPSNQLVTGTLSDEIAFALESAGWARQDIEDRTAEIMAIMGLPNEPNRSPHALSGGQQQRLVVGSAIGGRAPLLLLDEPLAQLDPPAARDLVARLRDLADQGVAVLVVEHRLEACWRAADRIIVLDDGRVVANAAPDDIDLPLLRKLGLGIPGLIDLLDRVGQEHAPALRFGPAPEPRPCDPGPVLLTATDLHHRYDHVVALDGPSVDLRRGEWLAVLGPNGAGKSTLLKALAGHLDAGRVTRDGATRIVDVPQDPDLALFCATVREELAYGPHEDRLPEADVTRRVMHAARALAIDDLLDRPPQALSRGQRLRTAVAAAVACHPDVLVLDEPTSGQDRDQVEQMMRSLRSDGPGAVVFATHDVDLALRHATRVLLMDDGQIIAQGTPASVLPDIARRLSLPPLLALCAERGLPPMTAPSLAALVLEAS